MTADAEPTFQFRRCFAVRADKSLANVFWAELIGRAPEVTAEVRHTVHVGTDGGSGEVAAMQLLKHELT